MTLTDIVTDVAESRRHLTVYGDLAPDALADLRAFFRPYNAAVMIEPDPEPDLVGTATLTRAGTLLATSSLPDLLDYVEIAADQEFVREEPPAVVERADTTTVAVIEDGRRHLLRGSRVIEELAWRHRDGTVHAGFQRLTRYDVDDQTRDLYCNLAELGVDVTIYANLAPDAEPEVDVTADTEIDALECRFEDSAELADTWFVAYRGPDDRRAALAAREITPGRYTGFWTLQPALADRVLDRVETRYGDR